MRRRPRRPFFLSRSTWSSSHLIYIFNRSLSSSRHPVLVQRLRTVLAKRSFAISCWCDVARRRFWNVAKNASTNRRRHRLLCTTSPPAGVLKKPSARVDEKRAAVVRVQRTLFFSSRTELVIGRPVLLSCVCACVTVKNVIDLYIEDIIYI